MNTGESRLGDRDDKVVCHAKVLTRIMGRACHGLLRTGYTCDGNVSRFTGLVYMRWERVTACDVYNRGAVYGVHDRIKKAR